MKSKIFLSLVTVFACLVGYGQKNVRLVYYLKNSGQAVATKDSADYWMVVSPPDSSIDKKLYVVYEYYPNGKVRLMTNSRSKDINLLYQGKYIAYFPDGRKKRIGTYDKQGHPAGHEVQYYPNGKLQSIINYNAEGNVVYSECRDSTGKTMAGNGSGNWRQFDDTFKTVIAEGKIDSGVRVGAWQLKQGDSISLENEYKKGVLQRSLRHKRGEPDIYEKADTDPAYPGGEEGYRKLSSKIFVFPKSAELKDVSGTIAITFIVAEDGRLGNFKITHGVGFGMEEAELHVLQQSPPWIPATVNGKPVRAVWTKTYTITTTIVGRVRRL